MSHVRPVLALLVACVALVAQPALASAPTSEEREFAKLVQALLEVKTYNGIGATPGARVLTKGRQQVLVLGPELESVYRRLRGRAVILWCNRVFLSGEKQPDSLGAGGLEYRLPRRRVDFRPVLERGADVCTLAIRQPSSKSDEPQPAVILTTAIASVAMSEKGKIALDRWGPALRLSLATAVLDGDGDEDSGGDVVPMNFVATFKPLVALSGPGAEPPADGRVGVWTDGRLHRYLAVRTPLGHVFSSERNGEMITENTRYWLSSFEDFS